MKIDLTNINSAIIETIKNSALYKNASDVRNDIEEEEKLMLTDAVTTNGWDTVSICRVTALNERIKGEKTYPESIEAGQGQLQLKGEFAPWQIITGGDGRNVKIRVPMKNGTYTGMEFGKGNVFDLKDVYVDIQVTLSYFPMSNSKQMEDGSYELYVNNKTTGEEEPIAAVLSLKDPKKKMDNTNKHIERFI